MDYRIDEELEEMQAQLGEEEIPEEELEFDEKYAQLSDNELAALANSDDSYAQDYLLNKYKNFVRAKARSYFLIGADREDLVQEGMIGL